MSRIRVVLLLRLGVALTAIAPAAGGAQEMRPRQAQPGERAPNRERLERQFRERLGEIVRRRLNLSDDQMARLARTNERFESDRMDLLRQEREARMQLRREMVAGESANQQRIGELLDEALRIQRRRVDLVEREQRALAEFLTPLQRAQYFAIQEDLRRRMEEMRRGRQAQPGGPPGGRVPGRPPGGGRGPRPR